MFYETLKRNNKELCAYLRDKQIECRTLNIIQHHPKKATTMVQTKTFGSLRQKHIIGKLVQLCISQFQAFPSPRQIFQNRQIPAQWANICVKF